MDNLNSYGEGEVFLEHDQCLALVARASHFCHELNNMMMIIDGNVRRLLHEDDMNRRLVYQEKVAITLQRLQTEAEVLTQAYRPLKQQFLSEIQNKFAPRM